MKKIIAPLLLSTLACAAQAATITVDNATNGSVLGACTLRDAVAMVNDPGYSQTGNCASGDGNNDTIKFLLPPGSEIAVTGSHIEIQKDLIIDASALNGGITLDANLGGSGPGGNRIFHVTGGSSLKITGVTFRNGNAGSNYDDYGGGIYVDQHLTSHTLTLEGCAFEGNQASGGGAVYAYSATISNSTFEGNQADYSGGAVTAYYTTISNSTFEGNSASVGGAVYTDYHSTISNSTFEGNSADSYGGAVYARISATISNSTFEGNSASYYGGAVFVPEFFATISNSTFEGNSVTDGGGNGGGGAVYAFSLDARHLTLLNNTASSGFGQALYISNSATLHNSIIIGNDNNDQCAVAPWSNNIFTGSYNLEGYESSGVWQATATTCGSSIASPPSIGSALSTIIATTLVDNDGPTKTLKLPTGSPAIGAADPTPYAYNGTSQMLDDQGDWVDATLDQRGFARSAITLGRDLGAYEDRRTPPPSGSGTPIPALPAPLLLALAVAAGLLGRRHLNRNA